MGQDARHLFFPAFSDRHSVLFRFEIGQPYCPEFVFLCTYFDIFWHLVNIRDLTVFLLHICWIGPLCGPNWPPSYPQNIAINTLKRGSWGEKALSRVNGWDIPQNRPNVFLLIFAKVLDGLLKIFNFVPYFPEIFPNWKKSHNFFFYSHHRFWRPQEPQRCGHFL